VFLLVGLTGSGKTTWARTHERARRAVRLSVDEEVHTRNGRYNVDYPEHEYPAREAPVVADLRERLIALLAEGRDVVYDHGLWGRAERADYQRLVEQHGGRWRLIYFDVPAGELRRRLAERNRRTDANALTVSPEALEEFFERFEAPSGEGEEPPEAV
jgi:predicted kinase